jgi:hypothetical protein
MAAMPSTAGPMENLAWLARATSFSRGDEEAWPVADRAYPDVFSVEKACHLGPPLSKTDKPRVNLF